MQALRNILESGYFMNYIIHDALQETSAEEPQEEPRKTGLCGIVF